MKRRAVMMLLLAWASAAGAGTDGGARPRVEASAVAAVHVTVAPAVAVRAITASVDAGRVSAGDFSASIAFRVEASDQTVAMYVEASPMFKGGDASGAGAAPIPLAESSGVVISLASGGAAPPSRHVARLVAPGEPIGDLPTRRSEAVVLHSPSAGGFGQDIHVTVTWSQDDPARAQGQYVGHVRLTAMLLPD